MVYATKVVLVCLSLFAMGHTLSISPRKTSVGPFGMGPYGMTMHIGYPIGVYPGRYSGKYPGMYPVMYPGMGYGMLKDENGGESSSVTPDKTIEDQRPMENSEEVSDIQDKEKLTALSEAAKE